MAPFRFEDPAEWQRLDWALLQNGHVVLYHRDAILAEHVAWLAAHAYAVHPFECAAWRSEDDFHDDVARALAFPGYYGRNLDAFNDCVGDLDVPTADGGAALVFRRYDAFVARAPESAADLLDILATVGRRYLLTGQRLLALVQSGDPRIEFGPLGAQEARWNPREWLDADRLPRGAV